MAELKTTNDDNNSLKETNDNNNDNVSEIYTIFDQVNDVVPNIKQTVTEAMWSTGDGTLTTFATSSIQETTDYYIDVYDENPQIEETAQKQFAVAFGQIDGKGATVINVEGNDDTLTASKAIYSQYRNLLLPGSETQFTINGKVCDDIYVINFQRDRLKDMLDAGNWELTITTGDGTFTFIDNSSIVSPTSTSSGVNYDIVSGSIADGVQTTEVPPMDLTVGTAYVTQGVLIFSAKALDYYGVDLGLHVNTQDNNQYNFYDAIVSGASFKARNMQNVISTFYYARVKNAKYNYSNNPSFVIGDLGDIRNVDMYDNSNTFITTIGLYNDDNELLAVAKISKPLIKNFNTEALIRIKIDW